MQDLQLLAFICREIIMDEKTIIDLIIEAKYASNCFQAANIANGCRLFDLRTDEERMERVRRYRAWRSSQIFPKDDTASCYAKAIEGVDPPQMDWVDLIEAKPTQDIDRDEGEELADYFLRPASMEDVT